MVGLGLGSPAHRAAQANPVGRPIATAPEPLGIHETFQQADGMLIQALPVLADAPGDAPQQMTGQVRHEHPGHDEVSTVIRDEVKALTVVLLGRAHELVAQVELPGGRTPSQAGDGTGPGANQLTVGGELNKLASNIAICRNIAGVHYRSDYTASLRLGEQVAISILREQHSTFQENFAGFTFTTFDGEKITI